MNMIKLILIALCPIFVQAQVKLSGGAQQSPYTVGTLGTPTANTERLVTDGANSSDCTTGLGSTRVKCIYTGSAWVAIGGAGGGGTPGGSTTQVQYNSAGSFAGSSLFTFNSGTGEVTASSFSSSSTVAGEYKMFETSAIGNDYISLVAPDSVTTIQRLKLSASANTAGQTFQWGAPSSNISQATWATPIWAGQTNPNSYFDWTLGSAPGSPASGDIRLYPKTGSTLCAKTNGGTETCFGAGGSTPTWEFQLNPGSCNSNGAPSVAAWATDATGITFDCTSTRQAAVVFTNTGSPEIHTIFRLPSAFVAGTATLYLIAQELSFNSGSACFSVDTGRFTSGGSNAPTLTGSPGTATIASLNGNTRLGSVAVPLGSAVGGDWVKLSITRDNGCGSNVGGTVGLIGVELALSN